jgi:peptide/nickel transport system substrate-binding protein
MSIAARAIRTAGRLLAGGIAVLAAGFLLTGCGPEKSGGATAARRSTGERVIRIAARRLPQAAGDPSAHIGQPAINIWPAFYDALTFIDAEGHVQPWLATGWKRVTDDRWRFQLRRGVRFSNGEPFDASAVKSAVDNVLFGYGKDALVRTTLLPGIRGMKMIDRYSFDLLTDGPDPLLPKRLAQFYPLPPAYFARVGPQEFALKPIGTGPFVVTSWGVGRVVMTANRSSWRRPLVDGLEFTEIQDTTSRRQALLSGQIDIAQNVAPDDIAELKALGIDLSIAPEPRVRVIGFNVKPGSPLTSAKVRLALNHAINNRAIVDALLGGASPVASQIATPATDGYDSARKPYSYDPALARRLLSEAGYGKGFDLDMDVIAQNQSERVTFEAVAADFEEVGVNVTLHVIEFEQWRKRLFTGGFHSDLFSWALALDPVFDITRPWAYLSCDNPRPPFCQPAISALIAQSQRELDPDKRQQELARAFALMRDDPPAILMHEMTQVDAYRGITGYRIDNLFVHYDKLDLKPLQQ